ncbi:dihydrofolate reductase family protein [Plantactinospora sp. S1510]|uniref:Dihydrofolate reductase family protein n=1 Tax=Plantactinospora alkalitolerans TaxID=2789879 RepID=A0ABS0H3B9_9ACTN|nr:dihydrofolate reductase family protein [Plantactinospora alkalitolerans]MBF9132966.1 dihydrofolate reductase family protein [Plantactinospora alkalitolerans]
MRKIFLYMTSTVDGFVAGPDNELDWMIQAPDEELNADIVALLSTADAGFLGYPVAQGMVPFWRAVAADPNASKDSRAIAEAVNNLHTIVVSRTDVDVPWDDTEVLVAPDDAALFDAVTRMKQQPGRDLGVPGGVRTARAFVRLGLVDEYILHVHPVAIGAGKRLFPGPVGLTLIGAKTYPCGVVRVHYRNASR